MGRLPDHIDPAEALFEPVHAPALSLHLLKTPAVQYHYEGAPMSDDVNVLRDIHVARRSIPIADPPISSTRVRASDPKSAPKPARRSSRVGDHRRVASISCAFMRKAWLETELRQQCLLLLPTGSVLLTEIGQEQPTQVVTPEDPSRSRSSSGTRLSRMVWTWIGPASTALETRYAVNGSEVGAGSVRARTLLPKSRSSSEAFLYTGSRSMLQPPCPPTPEGSRAKHSSSMAAGK